MKNIVGIDIGVRGALALISPIGDLIEIADMPVLNDGPRGRPAVNAPLLAACGVSATHAAPVSWKRTVGIPAGRDWAKDVARSEAIRRWPDKAQLFARVKDDGRAEAALIAIAGMMKASGARNG